MKKKVSVTKPQTTAYKISVPTFAGPLDLLLHLISRSELDITAISLVEVTDQYLAQVEAMKQGRISELIDFIVIGARLVLIKSRALLPAPPVAIEGEEEED
ncbi:MAG: segregation/condensation protein A, partial [Methylococcales bacterium]|nr:segregation/condensation protein A [Methylococcales bacterium]